MRIIFLGTPEFAVPSLEILADHFEVVGVITAPDKPRGRGQKLIPSPVKEAAEKRGLLVLQPTNLKDPEFLATVRELRADLQCVVAFRMMPEVLWSMPPMGTFNLHGSLLPQYRGAAPIHWAVINGETQTGVTTFLLQHEIDTGNLLFQEPEPISPDDTTGTLYHRLMIKGASLVLKTAKALESGTVVPQPQIITGPLKLAPKLFREDGQIRWDQPATSIRNLVRGLNPTPGAWCEWYGQTFKIFQVKSISLDIQCQPGTLETDQKSYLRVKTSDGWLEVEEFQPEGKRRMTPADYFRGNRIG